ncbi:ABC transporter permease [Catalinimonas niigatensis]|uniref:ABC transporter permease n=1 Tax=Catalinimonas niigatensis TaxID=1397264 RepID=UPI002664E50A|nr:ABC transporter permease [Catalinimonas niigatensis]WPP48603.1 ABC transporter permease [Catalinimonas niigatensis]
MISSYLKIALRSMMKHRTFSFINVFGLAISLSACLLILSIIVVQYHYDDFHQDAERIYRLTSIHHKKGEPPRTFATTPAALAEYVQSHYHDIEQTVLLKKGLSGDFTAHDKTIPASGLYASEDFLQTFTFPLLSGNPKTALKAPFSLVITEEVAHKFFGQQDPLGQIVSLKDVGEFTITGLMANPPQQTHIKFEVLASHSTLAALERQGKSAANTDSWQALYDHYLYIKLREGADIQQLVNSFPQVSAEHYQDSDPVRADLSYQPLTDITPAGSVNNQLAPTMPAMMIYFLAGLVLVVMLSACFNYTNLSVARALSRAKEVGVRKVVGAKRSQLFMQFVSEAIIIALLALLAAMLLLQVLEPAFYSILDEEGRSVISFASGYSIYLYFGIFALLVGLLAGVFPALLLSRFNPVQVLKNLSGMKVMKGMNWRKALITTQFALSFIFLLSSLIIYQQFQYSINKDLGFESENILQVDLQGTSYEQYRQLVNQHKDVQGISATSYVLGSGFVHADYFKKAADDSLLINYVSASPSFVENMELKVIAGSNFSEQLNAEHEEFVVLNEYAVNALGYTSPTEAVGELLTIGNQEVRIRGVVKDFHYLPVMERIESFALRYRPQEFAHMQIKLSSTNIQATLTELEELWQQLDEVHPFEAKFFDEQLEEALAGLDILMKVIGYVAFLSICIACLGFLGISIYTAEIKMKEISIRKVLGAELYQLSFHFMKSFLLLLFIAILIGIPAAYFLNSLWLNNLAYRTTIGVGSLLLGALSLLVLGLFIVGSQALKLAFINPVSTLRNE